MLDPDGGKCGAPQGAGEAEAQRGAVAQAGQVGVDRFEDLARDRRRGGAIPDRQPAGFGGGAVHAGCHFPSFMRLSGWIVSQPDFRAGIHRHLVQSEALGLGQ